MALIRVTPQELRSKASELRGMNNQLKSQITEFQSGAQELGATWEGDSKQAFIKATENDKQQMDNFSDLIEKYCQTLEDIAKRYDEAEANNERIASSRNY